jgi:predicted transposase YdaD
MPAVAGKPADPYLLQGSPSVTVKPYDPTLKALVETEPESWPALLGQPTGPTDVIDADIATISGAADKVLRVSTTPPYLLHLEFVSGHDAAVLPRKLLLRNGLLQDRHGLRVRSAAVLLRPEADSPQMTGMYESSFPGEPAYLTFRYQVVRVWQLPPEPLLSSGLALLPLAPISAVTEAQLPIIIERMRGRLEKPPGRKRAQLVWAAAYLLLGLRYTPALAGQLFRGVVSMKESSTYQAILEEGRVEGELRGAVTEARKVLRLLGDDAFGPPDARTAAAIGRLHDLARLEDLLKQVRTATSWQELLGQPTPARRSGRRRSSP